MRLAIHLLMDLCRGPGDCVQVARHSDGRWRVTLYRGTSAGLSFIEAYDTLAYRAASEVYRQALESGDYCPLSSVP